MKNYEAPVMTVERFETSDVITKSILHVFTAPSANEKMKTTYDDLWEQE